MEAISLSVLNKTIQETIYEWLSDSIWVTAEIAQIKENYSGHCYIELIEKDPANDAIKAQQKAIIWNNTYRILKAYFQTSTGRELCAGLKILVKIRIEFHSVYGLSLIITDINPEFTAGDLALKKADTIKKLKAEGIFDINHQHPSPLVPQRIAIISSATAAGYLDFITHLTNNPFGYVFHITLFQAFMQGEKAGDSIIEALDEINFFTNDFDVVAIIRGGGSQTDLSCFDSYDLAANIAQFPLPVIAGIGHEQDESVADMVAWHKAKTPTAAAAALIDMVRSFDEQLNDCVQTALNCIENKIDEEKQILETICQHFHNQLKVLVSEYNNNLAIKLYKAVAAVNKTISRHELERKMTIINLNKLLKRYYLSKEAALQNIANMLPQSISNHLNWQAQLLKQFECIASIANPQHILKKGFSITLYNGKAVSSANGISPGSEITTVFFNGKIESVVKYSSPA